MHIHSSDLLLLLLLLFMLPPPSNLVFLIFYRVKVYKFTKSKFKDQGLIRRPHDKKIK